MRETTTPHFKWTPKAFGILAFWCGVVPYTMLYYVHEEVVCSIITIVVWMNFLRFKEATQLLLHISKYSRRSLSRTPKGPTEKFDILKVRDNERRLDLCYKMFFFIQGDQNNKQLLYFFRKANMKQKEKKPSFSPFPTCQHANRTLFHPESPASRLTVYSFKKIFFYYFPMIMYILWIRKRKKNEVTFRFSLFMIIKSRESWSKIYSLFVFNNFYVFLGLLFWAVVV